MDPGGPEILDHFTIHTGRAKSGWRSDHQRASQTSTTSTGSRDSFKNAVSSTESLDQDIMPWLQEHIQEIQIVDKKLAKKVAKSEGALAHIEVSAKTGQGWNSCSPTRYQKCWMNTYWRKRKDQVW